ncbi:hypothetical protein LOTGIDRAFT_159681 [Lottia gigantea]|uniref:EF-hand domain-containing protein n=1 Tax=Lottia gigantea TaxID=225164 RepID=V4AIT5_LOTGI|nr:hypothetical protein LOTGIDRAFT_159681 [Lottia gigantea]ESO96927.1 hypothetical protein LOTGIDRAFT_159681 [Lottia gigantea]
MPVKKGSKKKGKKKSLKSSKVDKEDVKLENMEPGSVVSGMKTDPVLAAASSSGKKKKKGKKKKMTKSERALAKLEKAVDKIREDEVHYDHLITRINQWLIEISPKAIPLFSKIDVTGDGILTYEEFKSGMFDLNIPLNKTELHLLTKLLDKDDSGEIDYTEFTKGLQHVRKESIELEKDKDEVSLILSERKPIPCPCCKMGVWQPYREKHPRYVLVDMRLVTFDSFKEHPGHISVLVHSHLSVYGLIEILVQQTHVLSTKLAVFINKTRNLEAMLPVDSSLEDCGYFGNTKESPQEVTLYYDYNVEFTDCPILMCDHYFGQKFELQV